MIEELEIYRVTCDSCGETKRIDLPNMSGLVRGSVICNKLTEEGWDMDVGLSHLNFEVAVFDRRAKVYCPNCKTQDQ
jgi:hypothetical protein